MKYSELTGLEKMAVRWVVGSKPSGWWRILVVFLYPAYLTWRHGWKVMEDDNLFFLLMLAILLFVDYLYAVGVARLFKRFDIELAPQSKAAA